MELKTLKAQVEHCLQRFPATRNSDIELMTTIWQEFYPQYVKTGGTGEKGIWLKDLNSLPREDNIKRLRAQFQNEAKLYLPTNLEIAKKRGMLEDEWRIALGYN